MVGKSLQFQEELGNCKFPAVKKCAERNGFHKKSTIQGGVLQSPIHMATPKLNPKPLTVTDCSSDHEVSVSAGGISSTTPIMLDGREGTNSGGAEK